MKGLGGSHTDQTIITFLEEAAKNSDIISTGTVSVDEVSPVIHSISPLYMVTTIVNVVSPVVQSIPPLDMVITPRRKFGRTRLSYNELGPRNQSKIRRVVEKNMTHLQEQLVSSNTDKHFFKDIVINTINKKTIFLQIVTKTKLSISYF